MSEVLWLLPVFFFILSFGLALIVFFFLKKTLKILIRLILVGLIILIALVGSVVIWYSLDKKEQLKRPATQKSR